MGRKKRIANKVPGQVDERLARLGSHLRLARTRRGLTLAKAAELIGFGTRSVREAERGNGSTSIRVTVALLEIFGLAEDLERVADPARDTEGLLLGGPQLRQRARRATPSKAPVQKPPQKPVVARAAVALPDDVRAHLSQTELAALGFVQRQGAARARELADAVGLRPHRLIGLMRELRRKLVGLGQRDFLTTEDFPDGDVVFRVEKGGRS